MISYAEPSLNRLLKRGYIISDVWTPLRDRCAERHATARFLDRLYAVPDPCESAAAFECFTHGDLPSMSLEELHGEKRRVQRRLDYDDRPSPWLFERLEHLQAHIAHRSRAAGVAHSKQRSTDPYFNAPERRGKGIPAAVLTFEGKSNG